jgi:hypothetical protein
MGLYTSDMRTSFHIKSLNSKNQRSQTISCPGNNPSDYLPTSFSGNERHHISDSAQAAMQPSSSVLPASAAKDPFLAGIFPILQATNHYVINNTILPDLKRRCGEELTKEMMDNGWWPSRIQRADLLAETVQ